jgi:hypothetical protein
MAEYSDEYEGDDRPMKRPGVNRMSDLRNKGPREENDFAHTTVGACLESIDMSMEMMHKSVAVLEERLSPVLMRMAEDSEGSIDGPRGDEGDCDIVDNLRSLDYRLGRIRRALESINRRVQL